MSIFDILKRELRLGATPQLSQAQQLLIEPPATRPTFLSSLLGNLPVSLRGAFGGEDVGGFGGAFGRGLESLEEQSRFGGAQSLLRQRLAAQEGQQALENRMSQQRLNISQEGLNIEKQREKRLSLAKPEPSTEEQVFEDLLAQGMTPLEAFRQIRPLVERAMIPGRDAPLPEDVEKQAIRMAGATTAAREAAKPESDKEMQAREQARARVDSIGADLDRMADAARMLKKHPGLAAAVGFPGVTKYLPGTNAAGFLTNLETLRSQIAFSTLQKMREMSKTGGALGQVSDKEGQLLQSNITGLDEHQKETEFQGALDRVIKFAEDSKARLYGALNTEGSSAAPQPGATAARPTNGQGRLLVEGVDF